MGDSSSGCILKDRCIRPGPGSSITPEMWARRPPDCARQPKTQPCGDQGQWPHLYEMSTVQCHDPKGQHLDLGESPPAPMEM
ncbi:hypothetical protein Y1Q_0009705 [Alligator mississippiensis]|uniref:Uncharacterized protein n=1 Tax=Alligator mississippiensis TaxID=8496 RepID=A0A151MWH7_ALLMI|nr:hypothetical protein Y1Q_0009705 [Alligator mississippiensis]